MKPAAFDYVAPDSLDEAVAALAAAGGSAVPLAGGQSLVPLLNLRLARPSLLVDLNRLPGLAGIEVDDGMVRIGALVRQDDALRSPALAAHAPLLVRALAHVGHPATRSRGTVGGSVAHADPAAELPAALVALDGEVVLQGREGPRAVAADAFFAAPYVTARASGELLVEIRVPAAAPAERFGFCEVARRHGDFALAGAAVRIGTGAAPRVVLFGVAGTPVRAPSVEISLSSGVPTADAAALADDGLDPPDDVHATAAYRRRLARVVVARALAEAARG